MGCILFHCVIKMHPVERQGGTCILYFTTNYSRGSIFRIIFNRCEQVVLDLVAFKTAVKQKLQQFSNKTSIYLIDSKIHTTFKTILVEDKIIPTLHIA